MIRQPRWQLSVFLLLCAMAGFAVLSTSVHDESLVRADEKPKAVAAKAEGGWGTLKGRFVYGGPVPQPVKIVVPNKPELAVCKKHPIVDESLVVNAENKGIVNVFVYLRRAPAVHPELLDPPGSPAVLDQKGCTFIPHAQIDPRALDIINVPRAGRVLGESRHVPQEVLNTPDEIKRLEQARTDAQQQQQAIEQMGVGATAAKDNAQAIQTLQGG